MVAPARERGLKYDNRQNQQVHTYVAPARERGLKCPMPMYGIPGMMVAPARERGLKLMMVCLGILLAVRRSRKGAWIEMALTAGYNLFRSVAPARERGLKFQHGRTKEVITSRSLPQGSVD